MLLALAKEISYINILERKIFGNIMLVEQTVHILVGGRENNLDTRCLRFAYVRIKQPGIVVIKFYYIRHVEPLYNYETWSIYCTCKMLKTVIMYISGYFPYACVIAQGK